MTGLTPDLKTLDLKNRRDRLFVLHRDLPDEDEPETRPEREHRVISPGFAREFQQRAAFSLDRPALIKPRGRFF